jgi:hypothetical protein
VVLVTSSAIVANGVLSLVAIAVTARTAWVATAALWMLLAGTVALAGGLVEMLLAVRNSDDAVDVEARRVLALGRRDG